MACDNSSEPNLRLRRRIRWLVPIALVIGIVVADGSRTTPADATRPIIFRGDSPFVAPESSVLRVATFNIHSGRGRDRKLDLARTASVFPGATDIAGLNEVRGSGDASLGPDQAATLGSLLHMRSAFAATERRWWHDHFGNAIVARIPIQHVHRFPLPGTRGKAFRNAILIQFEFRGQAVQMLSAHVDSQSDRELQLRAVLSLFQGLRSPAILIGDLNSNPDDPQIKELLAQPDVVDALAEATSKTTRPHIDWILVRGFQCRSGQLIENDASDHPLAIADLELPEPTP